MTHSIKIITSALLLASMSCSAIKITKEDSYDSIKLALETSFEGMDTDEDKYLSPEEIASGLVNNWEEDFWRKIQTQDGKHANKLLVELLLTDLRTTAGDESISFEDVDADGDGEISKEEALKYTKDSLVKTALKEGDLNNDGYLAFDEYAMQIAKFMKRKQEAESKKNNVNMKPPQVITERV